jgi:TetR/AcrR family transcriptional regulator, transcriptional repressor for nem operon
MHRTIWRTIIIQLPPLVVKRMDIILMEATMGHSQEQKRATHDRIVQNAASRFRERGFNGISVADLMNEVGMTVGGFYKHFSSRDALVGEALVVALQDYNAFEGAKSDASLVIDRYLSEEHRDSIGTGCALGALAGFMPQVGSAEKQIYTAQFTESLAAAEVSIARGAPDEERAAAVLMMCSLIGAITVARAVDDQVLSAEILCTVAVQLKQVTAR